MTVRLLYTQKFRAYNHLDLIETQSYLAVLPDLPAFASFSCSFLFP